MQRVCSARHGSCLCFVCVAALFGCGDAVEYGTHVSNARASYTSGDCPFGVPEGLPLQCGALTVPEDYGRPDGKVIELAVARLASTGEHPAADPLVYLSGGPGSGGILEGLSLFESLLPSLRARELIFIDQRGTGYSRPRLDCPEVLRLDDEETGLRALRACRKRLTDEGVDLAQYHTEHSARDLRALREALNIETWNPLGTSYGTRLVLEMMRVDPQGTRAAILDSTLPPDVDNLAQTAEALQESIDVVFAACRAADGCSARYPELESRFFALIGRLNDSPLRVELTSGTIILDGTDLVKLVRRMLHDARAVRWLPGLISALERDDLTLLFLLFARDEHEEDTPSRAPVGMYLSVICAEWTPQTSIEELAAAAVSVPPEFVAALDVEGLLRACEAWNVPVAASAQFQPVQSEVPTLVLAGAVDPATPPRWGMHATETLEHSHFSLFQRLSHGVILSECGAQFVADFLDQPSIVSDPHCNEHDLPLFAGDEDVEVKHREMLPVPALRHRSPLPWLE